MNINYLDKIRQTNQHISKPALETLQSLLEHMGVILAQDYNMAKLTVSIWLRHATHQYIEKDIKGGKIIGTHILTPTCPAYDEFIVGHTDRSLLVASINKFKVDEKNLIFNPVVISNGKVIGIWAVDL